MKLRKILFTIISAAAAVNICAGAIAGTAHGAEEFPKTSAMAYAVYDTASGRFLGGKNTGKTLPMASTTKIMTAITAIERLDIKKEITITKEHLSEGSSMYLRVGERLTIEQLLYGLMLMSGNDAARAIADSSGSIDKFVGWMNETAAEIGMESSSFMNPNGLDEEGHYSTAKDMALLAAYAMKNETFREIAGTRSISIAGRSMRNHNKLLRLVDGATGVKTGYTSRSGRCLVSAVERDGREIIVVTLNAPSDWSDHRALYEYAFSKYSVEKVISQGHALCYLPVISGDVPRVAVYAGENVLVSVKEEERAALKTQLYLSRFVYAPVQKDGYAGEAVIMLDGEEVGRTKLYFDDDAGVLKGRRGLLDKISEFAKNIVMG
ncbi:MAG: D-alanyl-D-alanine carboxypeptidase [Oscillospiraceae bacterium]|jgi:D-alanyl-D-alanine carboxypeptidase|nr:D-alanyl-D-alanine carboxypeptidase [Oscillospiraceae bacterium]